ncbi:RHS repeat-associated core domain-containing protein [Frischella perrara]|uniref:RHS repeat-associated core domain-containing protein n=1 Tax=Frischella perrara TaxID=1267021 RepID=UPI0015E8A59D|nr:RHS repeat-associated core domain-containing protein [Frischella perrara]
MGTPQELVTTQGEIVWSAVYKSYGNLAIDYQTVPQPLRLPGQYFDEESGLHYNRHRYYDPHCARYISQDPIGLAGGENAYSYVANPITWIDPLGLNEVCPGTVNTTQAGDVSTSSVKVNIANDFIKNPQSIWGKSADDIAKDFQAAGYQVNVRQSSRGSGQAVIIEVKGHPEISQVQIHPGGGRHGGSYYKVSTTTQGTLKVVDSNTYKPSAGEKATIINKPKE